MPAINIQFATGIAIFALLLCPLNVLGQTYIVPPVQSAPVQYDQYSQGGTQAFASGTFVPQQGQVIPATATSSTEQAFPPAQIIPGISNQQPGTVTLPSSASTPAPSIQIPWTQELVKDVQTHHDFGSVPTSSQQEHVFEFVNTSEATLNLVSVRASCGCTKPTVMTPLVQPGDTAKVKAKFDTMKFRGEKSATVTVGVNRIGDFNEYGEVQFSVKGKIRKDVVLSPGNVSFDNVMAATGSQRKVKMKYAGNPLWQILRIESTNPKISAEATEVKREGGRITYELVVKLSESQPAGSIADELYVITNDAKVNKMPISVVGLVRSALEASPIKLGDVKQGAKVEKRFVIRGQQPFAISEVRVGTELISFALPSGEKALHVLKYTLDTTQPGEINDTITVVTADPAQPDSPLEKAVEFSARIIAQN